MVFHCDYVSQGMTVVFTNEPIVHHCGLWYCHRVCVRDLSDCQFSSLDVHQLQLRNIFCIQFVAYSSNFNLSYVAAVVYTELLHFFWLSKPEAFEQFFFRAGNCPYKGSSFLFCSNKINWKYEELDWTRCMR